VRKLLSSVGAGLLVVVIGAAVVASAQSKAGAGSIKGVWRIVEQSQAGPNGRTVDRTPVGMGGMIIITDRHWSYITEQGDKRRPLLAQADVPTASADQLRAAWGPFDAQGGFVDIKGNELILRHLVAKGAGAVDATVPLVVSFKVDGNAASITQVRGAQGPFQNPVTWRLTRLE
jgi:hypothetical protein